MFGDTERVIRLTVDILRKCDRGPFVYRGEPKCYPIVSSTLFRKFNDSEFDDETFSLDRVEQDIARQAKDYVAAGSHDDILTEVQHFGGATNLIDFTDDYLIALFFASASYPDSDGRIVFRWSASGGVVRPKRANSRAVFQKSVMVRTPRGFFIPDDDHIVIVPADLKKDILEFLEQCHGISEERIYDDIHGYIQSQQPILTPYATEFLLSSHLERPVTKPNLDRIAATAGGIHLFTARTFLHQKGMEYVEHFCDGSRSIFSWDPMDGEEAAPREDLYLLPDEIIYFLSAWIKGTGAESAKAYAWRGNAHLFQGSVDLARADFDRALELDSYLVDAHHGRANLHKHQGDDSAAMADLERALEQNPVFKAALIDRGNARLKAGLLEEAIRDFNAVISGTQERDRYTWYRDGHFFRALTRCIQTQWHDAAEDFDRARRGGLRVARSFQNIFGGIEKFEEDNDLNLLAVVKTHLYVPDRASLERRLHP